MWRKIAVILMAVIFSVSACRSGTRVDPAGSPATGAEPSPSERRGDASGFDYYLLNLSWSPEFCYSHRDAPECAARSTFVMHGLWPENNDGSYPESCRNAPGPRDPSMYRDLYADAGLLAHEWERHGTCTGLGADAYFSSARKAFQSVRIPPALSHLNSQTALPPDAIIRMFTDSNPAIPESSFAVSCGHNFLTAVEVCLGKSLRPLPCSGIRTCRARTVRIPAP
jgi:ribonuclease T2